MTTYTITPDALQQHAQWLQNASTGEKLVVPFGADLRGANLLGADLSGAKGLAIVEDAPQRLQDVAKAALAPGALNMSIADWAISQAGSVGKLLEKTHGAQIAGLMLLGTEAHSHFFDSDENARKYLQEVLN